MKKLTLVILLLIVAMHMSAQKTIQVSNDPGLGIIADETSLQTAIDNASPGDTLLVYPSGRSYGRVNIDKPLHIIGFGFRTDTTQQPSLGIESQAFDTYAFQVNVTQGGQNGSIQSLRVEERTTITAANNYRIIRCNLETLNVMNVSNFELRGNFIGPGRISTSNRCNNIGSTIAYNAILRNVQNAIIENNIFSIEDLVTDGSGCNTRRTLWVDNASGNITIRQNIFRDIVNASNSYIYNNILTEIGSVGGSNSTTDNNFVCDQDETPNCDEVFVGYPTGDYSFDSRYQLSSTSPAKGAGRNGEDCGVFGGASPYQLSGIPKRPLIYQLDVPGNAQGGSMTIEVKVRSGN
ncbi:MAG: hypothetical protein Sapg2KO_37730 [Saprospiraceae bacterium]